MTQIVVDRMGRSGAEARSTRTPRPRTTPGTPARTRRRAAGSGRVAGPALRPVESCPAPSLAQSPSARAHSCVVPAPKVAVAHGAVGGASTWRLTERGVAVVLVTGLMIMMAALTVVSLTALKVTGDGYQPSVTASLPR